MSTPECCKIVKWTVGQSDVSIVVHRPRAGSRLFDPTEVQHDFGKARIKVPVLLQIFEMEIPAGRKHNAVIDIFDEQIAEIL
jgi:hypothetical protein